MSGADTGVCGHRFQKTHASLVVLRGAEIGRDFRLRTLLGRGLETDIRILDDLASREHASIEPEWDGDRSTTASSCAICIEPE